MKKHVAFLPFWMLLAVLLVPQCKQTDNAYKTKAENPEFMHRGVRRITDIIRNDIFAPPVSARIYAYSTVAAYEALVPGHPEYQTLAGQLNGLTPGPQPEAGKEYCYPLASITALMKVGKQLVFSEAKMEDLKEDIFGEFQAMNIPDDVYKRSTEFGEAVAAHILKWAKTDNYAELRSAPKFTVTMDDAARWVPTPPQYNDALEPHWREMRPWVLDSASQFLAPPPVKFSAEKNSDFYNAAKEIYDLSKTMNADERQAGLYWDDNPFEVTVSGHFMVSTKKISPGGHWMDIAGTACRKAKTDFIGAAQTYALVALGLTDAFISCWDTKYTYNLVRPETYINRYIDPEWHPLIETPPFPEYTSGHSTVSSAAAAVLTTIYGDNFEFTDSLETEFGLGARSFKSFFEASDQAGMSRLWGGIHYRMGHEGGRAAGRLVAKFVMDNVKTKR